MNYEEASAEQIANHFETISRQRIQQLVEKFRARANEHVLEKLKQAKAILKSRRYELKYGHKLDVQAAGRIWRGLIRRVGKHEAYLDCTIAWKSEAEFREWAVKQIGWRANTFELDKDILVKGNRVYGPDTCVFVPGELNMILSGCYRAKRRGPYPLGVSFNKGSGTFVAQMSNRKEFGLDKYLGSFPTAEEAFACYKATKETRIKALADRWKDQIDPRAYEALLARQVEWND